MNSKDRHVTWDNFRENFIAPGTPALHRVGGAGETYIFVDESGGRIGLRTPVSHSDRNVASPLEAVRLRVVSIDGKEYFEVATSAANLYQQFYALITDIADRIQLKSRPPSLAIAEALDDWKELLKEIPILPVEKQLGLLGELWMLERLNRQLGAGALDSWVGPLGEPHDFRVGRLEFEVKTTRETSRIHVINGLSQLVASPEHKLYILSLQLEPAGASSGRSLVDAVAAVRTLFEPKTSVIDSILHSLGYRNEDAARYPMRYQPRTPACLIQVDSKCPKLTPSDLVHAIGGTLSARVEDVHYRVNLEHLGVHDGDRKFLAVLP